MLLVWGWDKVHIEETLVHWEPAVPDWRCRVGSPWTWGGLRYNPCTHQDFRVSPQGWTLTLTAHCAGQPQGRAVPGARADLSFTDCWAQFSLLNLSTIQVPFLRAG